MKDCKGISLIEVVVSIAILSIVFAISFTSITIYKTLQEEMIFKENLLNTLQNIIIDATENPEDYKYFTRVYLNDKGLEYPYETSSYVELIGDDGIDAIIFTIRAYKNHTTIPFPLGGDNIVSEIKIYAHE